MEHPHKDGLCAQLGAAFAISSIRELVPPDRVYPAAAETGAAMWWELIALVIATVCIPALAIIGLFYIGALKRAGDLPHHVAE